VTPLYTLTSQRNLQITDLTSPSSFVEQNSCNFFNKEAVQRCQEEEASRIFKPSELSNFEGSTTSNVKNNSANSNCAAQTNKIQESAASLKQLVDFEQMSDEDFLMKHVFETNSSLEEVLEKVRFDIQHPKLFSSGN